MKWASGPTAAWVDEDDLVFEHELQEAAETLKASLRQRLAILEDYDLSANDIVAEARRQVATAAVDGDLTKASDLQELVMQVLLARDESRL